MIMVSDHLYVGSSADTHMVKLCGIQAVLNVAMDLPNPELPERVEYSKVGLVDGPGNLNSAYMAAVLALRSIHPRYRTLVCCHSGSRSISVVLMYLESIFERGWDEWIEIISERADITLLDPHSAHKQAFNRIDWQKLARLASEGD